MDNTIYLALGSNLGDRRANLIDALSQLRQKVLVEEMSSVYETKPAYKDDQPYYLNAVLRGSTQLSPQELLLFLNAIERRMGRENITQYGPRPIDLDLLIYGNIVLDDPDLTIPHPHLAERPFVLIPFAEIASDLTLPGSSEQIGALAKQAEGADTVVRLDQALTPRLIRDVQDEPPSTQLSLTHVGLTGIDHVVRLVGKERDELFYVEMDIFVELRPDQKGVHMSRFSDTVEEVITLVSSEKLNTLETLAERIAVEVLHNQTAIRSDVHLRAHFPQERYAPISGKRTQEIYKLIGMAAATEHRVVHLVGIEAEGMMACPCAQDMIASQARERLLEIGFTPEDTERALEVVPLATHNQRGRGILIVGTDAVVHAEDLVHIVEGAMSSENYHLLKRPDELFVVSKAHRRPRFVEDAVREMIYGLIDAFPDLPGDTFVQARQVNMETIHKHDVYAERVGTLAELRQEISGNAYVTPHTTLDHWLRDQLRQ